MTQFRFGAPIIGEVAEGVKWNSFPIFDQRSLVFSLCVGAVLAALVATAWHLLSPASLPLGLPSASEVLVFLVVLAVAHETLHLLAFPDAGLNKNTVVGIWPEFASPFVQYLSPMPRQRFLLVSILPFITISICPFVLLWGNSFYISHVSWLSVANCIGAGSDIYVFYKVMSAVPPTALVVERGDKMCWGKSNAGCDIT